ncbi:MAG: ThuA domain-containing protein [Anaerolineae bacterium]|nr:ThuA domain-containing protein [Anaerolineae bacterium]
MADIRTAIVTGGHSFDVIGFHALFRALDGVDPYIQHMEDFIAAPDAVRDSYDVIVLFTHFKGAEYEQPTFARVEPIFEHLATTQQGILALHHGLLAYPDWPLWDAIIGMTERRLTRYSHDETISLQVADPDHPITARVANWTMIDETYMIHDAPAENHVLLTTDHPDSFKTLAWTRQYNQHRVFCLSSGHDDQTWVDPNFRRVLHQGIQWCAGR